MIDYIIIWVIIAIAAIIIYRRIFANGYWDRRHDPIYFDRSDPGDVYEYRAITEQRRYGRERGGPLIWRDD